MEVGLNPYTPPTSAERGAERAATDAPVGIGWRLLGGALYVVGIFVGPVGLISLLSWIWILIQPGPRPLGYIRAALFGSTLLLLGVSWFLSGRYFWSGRIKAGSFAFAAGLIGPMCLLVLRAFAR